MVPIWRTGESWTYPTLCIRAIQIYNSALKWFTRFPLLRSVSSFSFLLSQILKFHLSRARERERERERERRAFSMLENDKSFKGRCPWTVISRDSFAFTFHFGDASWTIFASCRPVAAALSGVELAGGKRKKEGWEKKKTGERGNKGGLSFVRPSRTSSF